VVWWLVSLVSEDSAVTIFRVEMPTLKVVPALSSDTFVFNGITTQKQMHSTSILYLLSMKFIK
jgi:hypothetical protein